MYRLIILLECILGGAFCLLLISLITFGRGIFPGEVHVLSGLAIVLVVLFMLGSHFATNDVKLSQADRNKARNPTRHSSLYSESAPGRDLYLVGATLGVLGGYGLLTGDSLVCGSKEAAFCRAAQTLAAPLGMPNINTIDLMLVLCALISCFWGLWRDRILRLPR